MIVNTGITTFTIIAPQDDCSCLFSFPLEFSGKKPGRNLNRQFFPGRPDNGIHQFVTLNRIYLALPYAVFLFEAVQNFDACFGFGVV
jgi:hypothetical protein